MEAINKYYLNNGTIYPIKEFTDEDSKEKIIYEVLRVVNGKPAFLKDHLERMKKSFKLINKEFPYDEDEIEKLIIEVIKKNDNALGNIKITCNVNNNNFKIYYIMHSYPSKEYYKKGVKVILYYGERENPNLKVVSTAFRAKIAEKMKEANAHEALLVDRHGFITEGSKSNFFGIKDSWNKAESNMTFFTKEQVQNLFDEFDIIKFNEVEKESLTGLGNMKYWHIFNVIAKKKN